MRPTSFRAAAIIPELVTLIRTAVPDAEVVDGPSVARTAPTLQILVGWGDFATHSATAERTDADIGGRMGENGEIACYIATRFGNADIAAARTAVVDALGAIEAAIREDTTRLGGTVDYAEIGKRMGLRQDQSSMSGATASIVFSVAYEAFI